MLNIAGTHIGLIWSYYSHPILSVYSLAFLRYDPVFIVIQFCRYIGLYSYDNNRAFANGKIYIVC